MKEIDARGLACPAPVLQTKATLQEEKPNSVNVIVDNTASQRVLERLGFRREGLLRGYFVLDQQRVDNYVYAILRSDWLPAR